VGQQQEDGKVKQKIAVLRLSARAYKYSFEIGASSKCAEAINFSTVENF